MVYKKVIPSPRLYKYISIRGKTIDGKLVVGNVFQLIDGMGINLTDLLFCCKEKNLVIDWVELVDECFDHNWSPNRMLVKFEEALQDVYGKDSDIFILGIKLHISRKVHL